MSPFEAEGSIAPQPPQPAEVVHQASLASRIADRAAGLARPIMVGAALAGPVAVVASEAYSPVTADAAASARNWKRENCTNGRMNTVICLGNAAAQCNQIAMSSTFDIKTKYAGRSKYVVTGKSYDMGGCIPVGSKELTIWQERRLPGQADFTRSSTVMKLTTGARTTNFRKTVKAPYSCDQGPIETRDAVATRFVAKKGTGLKSSIKTIRYEKTKTLC